MISECCSDISNLRHIENRQARVYLAGVSSLNTLKVMEEVLDAHPNIQRGIILPRPPRVDDRHLHQLSMLGTRELARSLPASRHFSKIYLGDYSQLHPRTVEQEVVLFGQEGDGVHLKTQAGRNLLTAAVLRSIKPLIN